MAKVLFLEGNLTKSESSYASQMLYEFKNQYMLAHPEDEVEMVNLNDTEFAQVFLHNSNFGTYWKDVNSDKWIDKLKSVDKVVLSCSMTNFGPNAVVKNFIDGVAVANKTFSYKYSKKGEAIGLLDHLSVMVVASQGAPRDWYLWGSHIEWLKGTWKFLGAKVVDTIEIAGTKLAPINTQTPAEYASSQKEALMEKAKHF
ncbi:FMN-dependent NADH-azoreductase [Mycoplasmopsis citelli]|uniref:FMN-dependent NADH-azoreductase n=1 Tax=Mycoplasmopsis citelli TaxID=171281 RepID=UPI002114513C|nr:FMN-dependent NADH-azoreductase [Mycoplasmopsis citelli]UUD35945.1 FMN-dependent NADH-azoreductase [Mycoplasmopsis citelli]